MAWTNEKREAARQRMLARHQSGDQSVRPTEKPLPDDHCVCGLPANGDGVRCRTCIEEGCEGYDVAFSEEWDGVSYPSRRTRRIGEGPIENTDAWHLFMTWWFVTGPTMPSLALGPVMHTHGYEAVGPRRDPPRSFLDEWMDAPLPAVEPVCERCQEGRCNRGGYRAGCRCTVCRAAHNEYMKRYLATHPEQRAKREVRRKRRLQRTTQEAA